MLSGLSLVMVRGAPLAGGAQASRHSGLLCCGAQALGSWASVVAVRELSTCGVQA